MKDQIGAIDSVQHEYVRCCGGQVDWNRGQRTEDLVQKLLRAPSETYESCIFFPSYLGKSMEWCCSRPDGGFVNKRSFSLKHHL